MNYHSESSRTLILQVIRWSFEALGTLSCDSVGRFFRLENNQYVERLSVAVYLIQDLAGTQRAILGDANSLVITIPIDYDWQGGRSRPSFLECMTAYRPIWSM